MQPKTFLLVLVLFSSASFATASVAGCDTKCQIREAYAGEEAAQSLMSKELQQGGRLGELIRVQMGLEACGVSGKSSAVAKLRRTRFDEIVGRRMKESPLGSAGDSEEQKHIALASFVSAAQALQIGYALGYKESLMSTLGISDSTKKGICAAYDKVADGVLFGDS